MADDDGGMMPDEGQGAMGHDPLETGALSYLSARWIQARMSRVANEATAIINRIVGDGLLKDGFGFAETPITDDMLQRMTPEQFETLLETIPSIEEKQALMARMGYKKLPAKMLIPPEKPTTSPAPAPHLAFTQADQVHSVGES